MLNYIYISSSNLLKTLIWVISNLTHIIINITDKEKEALKRNMDCASKIKMFVEVNEWSQVKFSLERIKNTLTPQNINAVLPHYRRRYNSPLT